MGVGHDNYANWKMPIYFIWTYKLSLLSVIFTTQCHIRHIALGIIFHNITFTIIILTICIELWKHFGTYITMFTFKTIFIISTGQILTVTAKITVEKCNMNVNICLFSGIIEYLRIYEIKEI